MEKKKKENLAEAEKKEQKARFDATQKRIQDKIDKGALDKKEGIEKIKAVSRIFTKLGGLYSEELWDEAKEYLDTLVDTPEGAETYGNIYEQEITALSAKRRASEERKKGFEWTKKGNALRARLVANDPSVKLGTIIRGASNIDETIILKKMLQDNQRKGEIHKSLDAELEKNKKKLLAKEAELFDKLRGTSQTTKERLLMIFSIHSMTLLRLSSGTTKTLLLKRQELFIGM